MKQQLLDIKLGLMTGAYFAITSSDVDQIMKIIVFILTMGYTARRWYLLEKKIKEGNED